MIELTYFSEQQTGKPAYQVIQFNTGEPWQIVNGDELIGNMEKLHGLWKLQSQIELPKGFVTDIGRLIDNQNFNKMPLELKARWAEHVHEVIMQSDALFLVICKEGIEFDQFKKIFCTYIGALAKDEWQIKFKVYNADMSEDFQVTINR